MKNMINNFIIYILTLSVILLIEIPSLNAEIIFLNNQLNEKVETVCASKVCAPEKVLFNDSTLTLRGHELFKYYFFNIYVASFYSERAIPSLDELFLVPGDKYLRLQYLRSISAQDFIDNSQDAIKKNPDINPEPIKEELASLYKAYEAVEKGDTYSLYFDQNKITTCLFKNDVRKVCLEGEAFAKAYFSIWLSEHSMNNEFSKRLISRK
jgi:hypothetical protein